MHNSGTTFWDHANTEWWVEYHKVCKNKERFDDRYCEHPQNRFAECSPEFCPMLEDVRRNSGICLLPAPPPKTPDHFRVTTDLIIQNTIPTTTWDECSGDNTIETILEKLLPSHSDEGVVVTKMIIREEYR